MGSPISENSIKELMPNLERLESLLDVKSNLVKSPFNLYSIWHDIEAEKVAYEVRDNIKLKSLLEENNLESQRNDLLFLAHTYLGIVKGWKEIKDTWKPIIGKGDELLNALKFFYDNDSGKIKIDIKHLTFNKSTSIRNQLLLNVIKEALLHYFIETDSFFEFGLADPAEIKDWGKYIDFVISEEGLQESQIKKKGRKKKHQQTGRMIDWLQKYLQEFTNIKAEENIPIARSQALFIYEFLAAINVLPEESFWKEDTIRHILLKERKKISRRKPVYMKELEDEYIEKKRRIKSKIKEINKKK